MSKEKKPEEPGKKKRNAIYLRLKGPLLDWLEEERDQRGGKESGANLQPIIKQKLRRQMEAEKQEKRKK